MTEASTEFKPRLIVEAIVLRACPSCGAKSTDPKEKTCQYCGRERPTNEDLGVIYDNQVKAEPNIMRRLLDWWYNK